MYVNDIKVKTRVCLKSAVTSTWGSEHVHEQPEESKGTGSLIKEAGSETGRWRYLTYKWLGWSAGEGTLVSLRLDKQGVETSSKGSSGPLAGHCTNQIASLPWNEPNQVDGGTSF